MPTPREAILEGTPGAAWGGGGSVDEPPRAGEGNPGVIGGEARSTSLIGSNDRG